MKLLQTSHRIWVCDEGRLESRRSVIILCLQQELEDMTPLFLLAQNFMCVF